MQRTSATKRVLISSRCACTIYVQRRGLAIEASRAGWDVLLAGDLTGCEAAAERLNAEALAFEPVPVDQGSMSPLSMARLLVAYIRLFRQSRPDVFHAFTIKPTIVGLMAARIARVPVRVATVAGLGHIFLTKSRAKRMIGLLLLRIALRVAHRVNFYNPSDLDLFHRLGLVCAAKARLTPGGSGVDTNRFAVPEGRPQEPFRVVFIGRLIREKGIVELLQAAEALRSASVPIKIAVVGDIDPNNPSSLNIGTIEAAARDGLVEWHGHVSDIRPIVAESHAVVLPSYREGIPMSLLEAAAMGRALVATDVPGCRDVVSHGRTGLLVPAQDALALANALEALAVDPVLVRQMGTEARRDAVERFDMSTVTRKVVDDYDNLLNSEGLTY